MSTFCTNLENLNDTARKILKEYSNERVFGLYGEMGAGKTTLIKEFCKILEIENVTSSPTFSIINEYWRSDGFPVYHFDFYRIKEFCNFNTDFSNKFRPFASPNRILAVIVMYSAVTQRIPLKNAITR